MSGFSLSTGLISGLDYGSIVDQLMAVEARPRDMLLQRIGNIDTQTTAYLDISARITSLVSQIDALTRSSTFKSARASSSLPDVLSASVNQSTPVGSYSFVVKALATSHQAVSRGFYDSTAPLSEGTLTIESAAARVNSNTQLSELNGHSGIQGGKFKIVDAAGQEATISVGDALTLADLIDRINEANVDVRASISDDHIVLTDTSDGSGTMKVQEVQGGATAASLGFAVGSRYDTDMDGVIEGQSILYLSDTSPLTALNDGLGIRSSAAGGDFTIKVGGDLISIDLSDTINANTRLDRLNHGQGVRLGTVRITSRDGTFTEVDLSEARTVGDVQHALDNAFGDGRLSVGLVDSRLTIRDTTDVNTDDENATTSPFIIEDVTGSAARDLGIAQSSDIGTINGDDILHMDTIGDVLTAIEYAVGNEGADKQPLVVATIGDDGKSIMLENRAGGPMVIEAPDASVSQALADLGIEAGVYPDIGGGAAAVGGRILSGLDTVMLRTLNGGNGFETGTIRIDSAEGSVDVDLSNAVTLQDVIRTINDAADDAGLSIRADYDQTGTRMVINNLGDGSSPITVSDVAGDFAAQTGLAQTANQIRSDNLQRQYINENTLLADLNGGQGIALGEFTVTNSAGLSANIDLSFRSKWTVGDLIEEINAENIGVEARINDTGDGIVLVDTAGGSNALEVTESGSTTARDLNILGEAVDGQIDGSFEFQFDTGGGETLSSIASRITNETTLASATILNDGTAGAPYRLSINSRISGKAGELIIDSGDTGLGISTLTEAQDARVLFGSSADSGILLTSSDNTFEGVVDGMDLTVSSVSDSPVTISVDRDIDGLVEKIQGLVSAYNEAIDRVREAGDYDPETEEGGPLLGDGTLFMVEDRLYRAFSKSYGDTGTTLTRLSQVGLTFGNNAHLQFDADKFRAAYASDPNGVTTFFTDSDDGAAVLIKKSLDGIAGTDGLIETRTETLADNKELLEGRVDYLNELLESKRARLMREFQVMESAMASLQSQQDALASLASMAGSATVSTQ